MTGGAHRRPPGRVARATSLVVAVGILALAALITESHPDGLTSQHSFRVEGRLGTAVQGRDLRATVHEATVARDLRRGDAGEPLATRGHWIVIDLTVATDVEPSGIGTADLELGERTYATRRVRGRDLTGVIIQPGLPRRGLLVFEVPEGAVDGTAVLALARSSDPRLDSTLAITIDLAEAPVTDLVELTEPVFAAAP